VRPDSRTYLFDEVSKDSTYEVIITTLGGLYRYATCDIFRVAGFVDRTPRLEYVGRRAGSDLTGEKLAEQQVVEAVASTLAEFDVRSAHFTVCAIQDVRVGERPRYVLVLETAAPWPTDRQDALARSLDASLRTVNSRYDMKRSFNDLGRLTIELVTQGAFAAYRALAI